MASLIDHTAASDDALSDVIPFASSRESQPSRRVILTMRVLCAVALCVTGYLAWTALTATKVFGCGGDVFDCGHVLNTRWSTLFGIPVGVPAFGLYACCLAALATCGTQFARQRPRFFWGLITTGGIAAGLAAIWFVSLQVFQIGHLCVWCLAAHSCGLAMAGLVVWTRPLGLRLTSQLAGVSAAAVAVLVGGQLLTPPPETFEIVRHTPEASDVANDLGGSIDTSTSDDAAGDLFAPPGDDLFAPPGDLFEPPAADSETEDTAEKPVDDAVPVETITVTQVRAGIPPLLVLLLLVSGLLFPGRAALAQESSSGSAADAKEAGDDKKETALATPAKPDPPRLVRISAANAQLNVKHWPRIGPANAKYIFVEMFDYTCPHCRATHRAIHGAFQRHPNQLAVVTLPVPLDASCNSTVRSTNAKHRESCEISRIAIALWRVNPPKFKQFHDWLFESGRTPTAASARRRAAEIVGEEALSAELKKPHARDYIRKHVELYKRAGSGSVPKLLFANSTLTGEIGSTDRLWNVIEREVKPGR